MDYDKVLENIKSDNNILFLKHLNEVNKNDLLGKEIHSKIIDFENSKHDLNKKDKVKYDSDIFSRLNQVDKIMYKKSWNKLAKEQKKVKILEFINTYIIHNNKNTDQIKKNILNDFEKNKLNSNKDVNYDFFSTQIIKISKLTYDKDSKEYKYS